MKKIILFISLILISYNGFSQTCECLSNLKWLIETFEKNDAGFQYVIDKKGENSYQVHNKLYSEKALVISDLNECHKLLNDWTEFFRKNHLNVQLLSNKKNKKNEIKLTDKEIIEKYSNSEKYNIKKKKFNKYIKKLKNNEGFEGIWVSEPYTIGIIKDNINPNREYVGFIINSQSPYWQDNQVKLEILKTKEGQYTMKFYMRDHSVHKFDKIEFYGKNYLIAGSGYIALKRVVSEKTNEINIERYFKAIYSNKAFLEKVSNNTVLLRIPSFRSSNKALIDSILDSNDKLIRNTENLIIDLRYNGGGDDGSFANITPYYYTNPIRIIGNALLSTELNNKRMVGYMNNPDLSNDDKKWYKERVDRLNKHIGEFVNLNDNSVRIQTLKEIYPNPKSVAILINEKCGSTTEQFLLSAKQSTKVKLFGTTTLGSLDISNLYTVISPTKKFKLWYGLSKSYRIPEMLIDEKGIQPDYYFDNEIKPYEWIDKTIEILNNK